MEKQGIENLTDEELDSLIAARLRKARERYSVGQQEAGDYTNTSKSYISRLESGKHTPNVWGLLARLTYRYKTSADFILGLTEDPTPANQKELPENLRELIQAVIALPSQRWVDLLAIAQVFVEMQDEEIEDPAGLSDEQRTNLARYDALMRVAERRFGADAIEEIEEELQATLKEEQTKKHRKAS